MNRVNLIHMFFRLLLAALVPFCGMRGLQACIGTGHFHLELAHSHEEHCGDHTHDKCPSDAPECGNYGDHVHIGLSIEDPANTTTGGIKAKKVEPRLIGFTVHCFSPNMASCRNSLAHPFETCPGGGMPQGNSPNARIVMLL